MLDIDHARLLSALTEYDRKQSRKRFHNPHALGHYCRGVGNVRRHCAAGHPLRAAILTEFSDRLADALLKAVGLEKMTDKEARYGCLPRLPELPDDDA